MTAGPALSIRRVTLAQTKRIDMVAGCEPRLPFRLARVIRIGHRPNGAATPAFPIVDGNYQVFGAS
jgi:hypothetical protein